VIFLSWSEAGGENYVMGRCLDISVGGLGVEVAKRIHVGTSVRVRADCGVFQLGLELKQPLPPEVLAKVVTPDQE
jgi:hypothetical protein